MIDLNTENELVTYEHHPLRDHPEQLRTIRGWAGYDPAKSRHLSHFSAFLPGGVNDGVLYQVASVWFKQGTPYIEQVERIKELVGLLNIRKLVFDNTNKVLETMLEEDRLGPAWEPITLAGGIRREIAGRLNHAVEQRKIVLLPDDRQQRSILAVSSALRAGTATTGDHGDAFWSTALALHAAASPVGMIDASKIKVIKSMAFQDLLMVVITAALSIDETPFCAGVWELIEDKDTRLMRYVLAEIQTATLTPSEQVKALWSLTTNYRAQHVVVEREKGQLLPANFPDVLSLEVGDMQAALAGLQPLIEQGKLVVLATPLVDEMLATVRRIAHWPKYGGPELVVCALAADVLKQIERMSVSKTLLFN